MGDWGWESCTAEVLRQGGRPAGKDVAPGSEPWWHLLGLLRATVESIRKCPTFLGPSSAAALSPFRTTGRASGEADSGPQIKDKCLTVRVAQQDKRR